MGRWERITARIEAMDEAQREAVLEEMEELLDERAASESDLTDEQVVELERRLADPGEIADDAEVEAFFARYATR